MTTKIEITISSDLDYENLIAELTMGGEFLGLVTNEPQIGFRFEVPENTVSEITIELDKFIEALNEAKAELLVR